MKRAIAKTTTTTTRTTCTESEKRRHSQQSCHGADSPESAFFALSFGAFWCISFCSFPPVLHSVPLSVFTLDCPCSHLAMVVYTFNYYYIMDLARKLSKAEEMAAENAVNAVDADSLPIGQPPAHFHFCSFTFSFLVNSTTIVSN